MQRIAFLILSVLLTVSVFAQDPGAKEKNAGNAAVKAALPAFFSVAPGS